MEQSTTPPVRRGWLQRPGSKALLVLAGLAAGYGLAEHWAHAAPYLPWLLVLACPLLHVFLHRGHGHGPRNSPGDAASGGGPRGNAPPPDADRS